MSATSWVEIDLVSLRHNVALLRRQTSPAAVWAVVKADAYGHGAVTIAAAALEAGAAGLCTFTVREAVELRAAGIDAPITCLGPILADEFGDALEGEISIVVDSVAMVEVVERAARERGLRAVVDINIDSGMQRYGVPREVALQIAERITESDALALRGLMTHFPDAGNPDRAETLVALARFERTRQAIGAPMAHASASAAIFHLPEARFDAVRAGIALYGIDPAPELGHALASQLEPVLSWRTRVLAVREVAAGESVSYGGLWTAARESRIGVTGVGYADGLPRRLSPGGAMLVRGRRAPIRGAICMDTTMIDLTDIPDAMIGDEVTIIGSDGGQSISAWDLANQLETIPYEICTGIASRVPRRTIE